MPHFYQLSPEELAAVQAMRKGETIMVADVPRLREDLALFTEFQLATLEGLPSRTSGRERRRQQSIADQMVEACRKHGVRLPPLTNPRHGLPRLRKLLGEF